MRARALIFLACLGCSSVVGAQNVNESPQDVGTARTPQQNALKVRYITQDTVYLAAGSSSGLVQGMKLIIKRLQTATAETTGEGTGAQVVAELQVISVTETSAVCNIEKEMAEIQIGDFAYMSAEQAELLSQQQTLGPSRKYPQVISFSEGDPLEEEIRDAVPKPPLPEINRIRGRFGFDYSGILSRGTIANTNNSQMGVVLRADVTRLWGTYWNVSGYWRGRMSRTTSVEQQSLQDLINRTYHMAVTYENPNSHWVAGFGRLYLPWASSLETIDGGYFGRKLARTVTGGFFAGSTPDPTSWSYDPNRRIAGGFINFEGGSFDNVHYTSTSGVGLSMLSWTIDRPFVFFENSLSYKKYISFYHSLQADNPKDATGQTRIGAGISRSFATLRLQPHDRVSFDINHNYLRDVPSFDVRLIGTGLLDKYLFQGISVGTRIQVWDGVTVYTSVGRSSRSGDTKSSTNFMYGVTVPKLGRTGLRADARYSVFNSSFGKGHYSSFSLSRNLADGIRVEGLFGRQNVLSLRTTQSISHFITWNVDANLGPRYFMQGGFTAERGGTFDYDQWMITIGYRFDNRTSGVKR